MIRKMTIISWTKVRSIICWDCFLLKRTDYSLSESPISHSPRLLATNQELIMMMLGVQHHIHVNANRTISPSKSNDDNDGHGPRCSSLPCLAHLKNAGFHHWSGRARKRIRTSMVSACESIGLQHHKQHIYGRCGADGEQRPIIYAYLFDIHLLKWYFIHLCASSEFFMPCRAVSAAKITRTYAD